EEKINVTTMANVVSSFAPDYMTDDGTMDVGFEQFVKSLISDSKMRVLILDPDSVVIFDSHHNMNVLNRAQIKTSVLTAIGGKTGYIEYSNDKNITVQDAAAPIMNDGSVVGVANVVYSAEEISLFRDATKKDIWLITIIVSMLVGFVIFLFTRFITKRIVDFTDKITSMSSDGILDEKLDIRGKDEISQLAVAFNTMSEKVLNLEHKRVEFVSNASHELKTPLSSIKLMADSIIQTPDIDMDYVREFLTDMNNEVDRLNRIVNKLLYITKMDNDAEKLEAGMEITSLGDILMGIEKNLMPIANRDEITLNVSAEQDIYVMANKDMLWQGIYNVVDNAIKYSNEFGTVEVQCVSEDDKAVIYVKDNGMGISQEDIGKIFERFYRVDKTRSRATGGTGLGLSIALGAIEFHNGTIEVESEPDVGSTFKITLPAV
ncbi:MAG: HAMP domain-containing histidine kinase, partial [Clostridia bacterium]|nr:HAMP domain-containing histidine kinase [Clostridia bacterium]